MNRVVKIIATICLISIITIFFAFRETSLTNSEYIRWVETKKNGLRVEKEIGDIHYTIQYKPTDYLLLKEKNNAGKNNETGILKKELNNMYHFNLRIGSKKTNDVLTVGTYSQDEYYAKVNYLSFDFQKDLFLVTDDDTIPCSFYQYVPNYSIAPFIEMIVGFNKPTNTGEDKSDKTFIIDDRVFGNGLVKLTIDKNDIHNIPEIKN